MRQIMPKHRSMVKGPTDHVFHLVRIAFDNPLQYVALDLLTRLYNVCNLRNLSFDYVQDVGRTKCIGVDSLECLLEITRREVIDFERTHESKALNSSLACQ